MLLVYVRILKLEENGYAVPERFPGSKGLLWGHPRKDIPSDVNCSRNHRLRPRSRGVSLSCACLDTSPEALKAPHASCIRTLVSFANFERLQLPSSRMLSVVFFEMGAQMTIKNIPLSSLAINRANDRHGELENETAAIAWLFSTREQHMRNLAKDIAERGEIYETPLVAPEGDRYIVFDGNRRVTCLKLIDDPRRAPTTELQAFFRVLKAGWPGAFPNQVQCQVEPDRDRIDEILFRRHTGTQNGIGQSNWDDRMKATFVERTGKGGGLNVADEIERRLKEANLLPTRRRIPRSILNRLLSAEPFRNRLGFTTKRGRFECTHKEEKTLNALARVASDLAHRTIVLADVWDVDGKRGYLDELEKEGILPNASDAISKPKSSPPKPGRPKPSPAPKAQLRATLIPHTDYGIVWPGRLQRHRRIWEELQFSLKLREHPNAISVLFRVLLELSVEQYIGQTNLAVHQNDKLHARALKIGRDLLQKDLIDAKQMGVLQKFQQSDQLISADTLNRYVHSPNFAPSPEHLTALWDTMSHFIVLCLKA